MAVSRAVGGVRPSHSRHSKTKRIPLLRRDGTRVAWTLVDARWFGYPNQWTWRLTHGYAVRRQIVGGKKVNIYIAREILGLELGDRREAEHINRNPLDNQEGNLRIAPRGPADNQQNVGIRVDNTSGYRGVGWHKRNRKWYARARLAGRQRHLGYYDTPGEAHTVVSSWRAKNMPFSQDAR